MRVSDSRPRDATKVSGPRTPFLVSGRTPTPPRPHGPREGPPRQDGKFQVFLLSPSSQSCLRLSKAESSFLWGRDEVVTAWNSWITARVSLSATSWGTYAEDLKSLGTSVLLLTPTAPCPQSQSTPVSKSNPSTFQDACYLHYRRVVTLARGTVA